MLETLRKPSAQVTTATGTKAERWWALLSPHGYALTIGAITLFGFFIRAARVWRYDFPLNDGGLFYAMARDLQRSAYLLPWVTTYNDAGIPFAYSPFGIYVVALLGQITPFSLDALFRIVPLLVTTGMIVAFAALAREILRAKPAAIAATLAFVLIPRSFIWLLMGGGVTRSFGMLFAILALTQAHRLYARRQMRAIVPTALFAALTLLSHAETGKFLVYSIVVFFLCYGLHRQGIIASLAVGAGTLLLSAPWWATVIVYHGLAPFRAANATGSSIFTGAGDRLNSLRMLRVFGLQTNEPYFWLIGTFALLGALLWVARALAASSRRSVALPALPLWWFVIVLLDNRAAGTYTTLPVALLAGVGIVDMLLPALRRAVESAAPPVAETVLAGSRAAQALRASVARSWPMLVVLALLLAYSTVSATTRNTDVSGDLPALTALSPDDRAAMRWAATQTPPGSRFLVVSGIGVWPTDMVSEWFPALAERASVATPQGYEWMPDQAFIGRIFRHGEAQACAWQDGNCLERWIPKTGTQFDYVYVRMNDVCCILGSNLLADPRYDLVYNGNGAMIFARRPPATSDALEP